MPRQAPKDAALAPDGDRHRHCWKRWFFTSAWARAVMGCCHAAQMTAADCFTLEAKLRSVRWTSSESWQLNQSSWRSPQSWTRRWTFSIGTQCSERQHTHAVTVTPMTHGSKTAVINRLDHSSRIRILRFFLKIQKTRRDFYVFWSGISKNVKT